MLLIAALASIIILTLKLTVSTINNNLLEGTANANQADVNRQNDAGSNNGGLSNGLSNVLNSVCGSVCRVMVKVGLCREEVLEEGGTQKYICAAGGLAIAGVIAGLVYTQVRKRAGD
jgi:hypothetical protein